MVYFLVLGAIAFAGYLIGGGWGALAAFLLGFFLPAAWFAPVDEEES